MQRSLSVSLETPRLICSHFYDEGAPVLFSFLGDPFAMKFTYCHRTEDECRQRLRVHEDQRNKLGIAPWIISDKLTGEIIGWGGLYEDPFDVGFGPELAYFFSPKVWGRGFGVEFAFACLNFARNSTVLNELCAFAHLDNIVSQKILKRVGFKCIRFSKKLNRLIFCLDISR